MNLLEKCNADVYKAILEIKEIQPRNWGKYCFACCKSTNLLGL
jgi:hypothetical protein